ncbi:rCG58164 [Rattus norvegicus]|uniref:RCG58164 n=1 Tax=Rattus norvegicus TaxID=10116 RepID=A6J559_RAT|nr:rCG58164 [Rattus norvegicus]
MFITQWPLSNPTTQPLPPLGPLSQNRLFFWCQQYWADSFLACLRAESTAISVSQALSQEPVLSWIPRKLMDREIEGN